jgi:LCP family protein required for cell wall assembly
LSRKPEQGYITVTAEVESSFMSYEHLEDSEKLGLHSPFDTGADTRPIQARKRSTTRRRRQLNTAGVGTLLGILLGVYLMFPGRINVLLLGIDRTPEGSAAGRSDTLILTTVKPLPGYTGVLSIPRDLWVTIPGVGENRINTAHFFAEAAVPGNGPRASVATVADNFGLDLEYYIRIQFNGFRSFIDTLGGIPIVLDRPVGKLPAGEFVLDGEQALAFVRDRSSSDDFARMAQGQVFLKALLTHILRPAIWPRLPIAMFQLSSAVDSNLPLWVWPRYAFTWLRAGPEGIDARLISREMVHGFTTNEGAQVLAPDWSRINPMLLEMFGQ